MGFISSIGDAFTGSGSMRGSRPEVPGTDIIGVPGNLGGFGGGAYGPLRVPAKYYLEIQSGGTFQYMTCLPYDPQSVTIQRKTPTNIVQTIGGVLREFSPQKRHTITLTGRSGVADRVAYNRNGGIIRQDGETIMMEFDEFLKQYNEVSSTLYNLTSDCMTSALASTWIQGFTNTYNALESKAPRAQYMVLRCIDEDAHFKVEPVSFAYARNTETNRFDYTYHLVLEAYDYAYDSKVYNPIMAAYDVVDNTIGLAGGFIGMGENAVRNVANDYVRGFAKAIREVGKIIDATNDLAGSFGALGDSFKSIGSAYCDTIDKFATMGDAWVEMSQHWQSDEAQAALRVFESDDEIAPEEAGEEANSANIEQDQQELRVIEQYTYSVEVPETDDEELKLLLSQIQAAENMLKNNAKIARGQIPKRFYDEYKNRSGKYYQQGKFLANESNLDKIALLHPERLGNNESARFNTIKSGVVVTLGRDEDLRKIAIKYLNDANQSSVLVDYNEWMDERRRGDGSLAQAGDTIVIPDGLLSVFNPFVEDGLVGGDISQGFDDLEFDTLSHDFQITTPEQTLRQTLKNILLTHEQEMRINPEFGVPHIVKTEFDPAIVGINIRDAITAHPYFVDCTNIVTSLEDDTFIVTCDVRTILGETIPVRTPGQDL